MATKKTTKQKPRTDGLISALFSVDETLERLMYEAETRLIGIVADAEARIKKILDDYEVKVIFERKQK